MQMRVIARPIIIAFYRKYPDSKSALESWYYEAKHALWERPDDIKKKFGNASIVRSNRIVFNICGNKYRLVAKIEYQLGIVFIRFIGTHEEYNEINVEVI